MRATVASAFLALALLGAGRDSLPAAPAERGAARLSIRDREGREVGWYRGSHALLIGNSVYSHGWQDLESIPAEIAQVRAVLIEHGFEVEEVTNATGDRLSGAFKDFVDRHGYEHDNRLLFYFAGHGHTRGKDKAYLVPVDAPQPGVDRLGFLARALPLADIEQWARKIEAKHALFVFDSCFSGAIFKTRSGPEPPPQISDYLMKDVRQFITSGSADEKVPAQSLFSRLLVEALRGAGDLNRDGYVTGTELGSYLHDQVLAQQVRKQTPQFGKIHDPALDKGDFVFVTGRREEPPPPAPPPPQRTAPPRPERRPGSDLRQDGRPRSDREDRLPQMRTEYDRLLELDKQERDPEAKAAAWRRFLREFGEDDPATEDDDRLRKEAEDSVLGWQEAARRAGTGTGSEAQVPQTPVRETLDTRLVSRAEYEDCVRRKWCSPLSRSGPCNRAVFSNRGSRPVICASWDQAVEFCKWANGPQASGRLPHREDWLDADGAGRSIEPALKEWIAGRTDDNPAFRTRSAIVHDPSGSVKALSVDRGEGQPNISFRCVRPESAPPG